jgi:acyl carrier protein
MPGKRMVNQNKAPEALTHTERALAALWVEVLQSQSSPSPRDDFFALGGDSMLMTMLEFRIAEEFSVELPPGIILRAPTLGQLSALIDAQ